MSKALRALIVDDSGNEIESMLQELRYGGCDPVYRHVDSLPAMSAAIEEQPWDIIVADYVQAKFDVISALNILKERALELPCIMISEAVDDEVKEEVMQAGVSAFILKSETTRLAPAIENILHEENVFCSCRSEKKSLQAFEIVTEELFKNFVDNLNIGLSVLSPDMEVIYSNKQMKEWFPKIDERKQPLCYRICRESQSDSICKYCPTKKTLNEGTLNKFLIKIPSEEGICNYSVITSPVLKGFGDITAAFQIVEDITEQKQTDDALRKSQEQLRQSQKIEALGMLAAGMTHDLNNMLTAIMGYADLMLLKLDADDPIRRNVEQVKKGGLRATNLIQQLLTFSRKQELQKKELNLNVLIADMESMLRCLISEEIEFIYNLDPELGKIKADKGQFEQVVMNLIVNASDAMSQGGNLVIETANVYLDEKGADPAKGIQPGRYVMLAIRDNGIGMDKETLAHIYEPFYTTKEHGKGTGLGLSTVYGIINQSKGHINVSSEFGKGTSFEIYMTLVDDASDQLAPDHSLGEALKGSETILLVEDEEEVRTMIREILQRNGYKVLDARSPGDAILLCEQYTGMIHLMLTDVVMPMMSGRELAERLVLWHPETKVLYMSGYTDEKVHSHGVLGGGTSFLEKPFIYKKLLQKIRQVLGASDSKDGIESESKMIQYNLF